MQFNTREFNYYDGTFTAEASTLGDRFSGEEDFELVSERTGRVIEMVLVGPRFNDERELTHWEFQPHNCFTFNNLIVFND